MNKNQIVLLLIISMLFSCSNKELSIDNSVTEAKTSFLNPVGKITIDDLGSLLGITKMHFKKILSNSGFVTDSTDKMTASFTQKRFIQIDSTSEVFEEPMGDDSTLIEQYYFLPLNSSNFFELRNFARLHFKFIKNSVPDAHETYESQNMIFKFCYRDSNDGKIFCMIFISKR